MPAASQGFRDSVFIFRYKPGCQRIIIRLIAMAAFRGGIDCDGGCFNCEAKMNLFKPS